MIKYLLPIFLMISVVATEAQEIMNKDSLLSLVPKAKQDSNAVLLYINIGQQYESDEPEIAKQYYRRAETLSKQIGYLLGEVKFIANYGFVLNMQGSYDSSLLLNLRAIELTRQLGDSVAYGKALFNTGTSYRLLGEYQQAVTFYERGKKILSELHDDAIDAQGGDILQVLYNDLHQFDRAIQLGEEAVRLSRKINNPTKLGYSLNNLGLNYSSTKQFDKAIESFNEVLKIGLEIGDKNMEQSAYLNLGDVHLQQGEYDDMKPYFEKALRLSEELHMTEGLLLSKKGLSLFYTYKRNYGLASQYGQEALALTYRYNLRRERAAVFSLLSNISFALQNMHEGEKYAMMSSLLSDSLLNETNRKDIADLEKKYELERKNGELQLKEVTIREKTLYNYLLFGGAVILLVIIFLSYGNYRQKRNLQQQRISELEAEKALMAVEAVLKGEENERSRLAKDLHDGLGGMLSGIKNSFTMMKGNLLMTPAVAEAFERSLDMLDSSIQEMRRVAHNMMPEALVTFGLNTALKDFCNDINQSGMILVTYQSIGLEETSIEQSASIAMYRIVQELINNVMKHASAKNVVVQISKEDQHFTITVEDDGRGFDKGQLQTSKGMGWRNIESRVAYLKGKLDIRSEVGKGTSVLVEFNGNV